MDDLTKQVVESVDTRDLVDELIRRHPYGAVIGLMRPGKTSDEPLQAIARVGGDMIVCYGILKHLGGEVDVSMMAWRVEHMKAIDEAEE